LTNLFENPAALADFAGNNLQAVPEPSTLLLVGMAGGFLAGARALRRRRARR
jgi:hypothetical protein